MSINDACIAVLPYFLIHLNVPLMVGLPFLEFGVPIQALRCGDLLQGIQNGGHHSLQTAKVATRAAVKSLEQLLSILLHHVLHIQLAAIERIRHLTRDRIVDLQLTRTSIPHHGIDLLLVQKPAAGGDAQHKPGRATKHMPCHSILHEKAMEKRPEGRNSGAGSNHDNIRVGILGQQHRLPNRPGDVHGGARRRIAQKARAHTLLGGIGHAGVGIIILRTAHAQTHGIAVQNVSVPSAGDGIQPRLVIAAIGRIGAGRDDAERLAFHVVHPLRQTEDDVLNVAGGIGGDDALPSQEGGRHGSIGLGKVDRQIVIEMFEPVLRIHNDGLLGWRSCRKLTTHSRGTVDPAICQVRSVRIRRRQDVVCPGLDAL
mmetsp:Transcript_5778/g.16280  ORF Transcript_5778/g.16280 Transcript_5778/m.16280 type:complete len:371 (-) Transcript_5778:406-1518(-)